MDSIYTEIAEMALVHNLQVNVRLVQCNNCNDTLMAMALKSEEMGHIHLDYQRLAAKIIHKRHIYIQNTTINV
jgi:hypothetical protein